MNEHPSDRVEELYRCAAVLDDSERDEYLTTTCGGDRDLRQEIESLVRSAAQTQRLEPALAPGTRLGPYQITRCIGIGGMGHVYEALDTRLDRVVAIKTLPSAAQAPPERRQRFLQEARAVGALNHPNIIAVYDIASEREHEFLVLEYAAGRTVQQLIGERDITVPEAIEIAVRIANALAAAHEAGIIHRDIKPGNVIVTPKGQVKVLDFGVAKLAPHRVASVDATESMMSTPGMIVGTLAYMSPEQAQGQRVDERTDVFALGAMLYEMLAGQRPFTAKTPLALISSIMRDDPAPPSGRNPGVPRQLDAIVLRALAKNPAERYQRASELERDLTELSDTLSGKRVRTWRFGAYAALLAVVVAAAVAWAIASRPKSFHAAAPHQLTFDAGIAATPAISPDGKLIAFSSDRGAPGKELAIWMRQSSGGGLLRMTTGAGPNTNPQFSSDGSRLYYLHAGDTILVMPVIGGPAQRVADNAGPFAVSKRGDIAFVPLRGGVQRTAPVFVIPAGSGAPRAWHPECRNSSRPAWSPEADRLFFFGSCGGDLQGGLGAALDAGPVRKTSDPPIRVAAWLASPAWVRLPNSSETILFPVPNGDGITIARSGLNGRSTPIMPGIEKQFWPAAAPDGSIVFTQGDLDNYIWTVALGQNAFRRPAMRRKVVPATGHFAVTHDGNVLVYARLVGKDAAELVVRDQRSGAERVFAEHELLGASLGSLWPQISPDGKRIAYRVVGRNGGIYLLDVQTAQVRRISTIEQFQLPTDWSPDSTAVLGECPQPHYGICTLSPVSGEVRTIAATKDQLLYPSWSWDGKAILFMRRPQNAPTQIWFAGVRAGAVAPESDWVRVTSGNADNSRPRFSADGTAVYYFRGEDGMRRVFAQRLNGRLGAPIGDPIQVVDAPAEFTVLGGGFGPYPLISVTRDALYYSSISLRGNLWMTTIE